MLLRLFIMAGAALLAFAPLAQAEESPPSLLEWLFGPVDSSRPVAQRPRPSSSAVFAGMPNREPRPLFRGTQTTRAATPTRSSGRGIAPQFLPRTVSYNTRHAKGTIVIDTNKRFLYLVLGNGKAKRYGVGVGRPGFSWRGTHRVTRKAEWPGWTPPKSMIAREARRGVKLPAHMPGGPNNPLGARALYLGSTLYRIHGSNQPWTIGHAVSSGCIRMRNEDVTDLYRRVGVGTKVVVL